MLLDTTIRRLNKLGELSMQGDITQSCGQDKK